MSAADIELLESRGVLVDPTEAVRPAKVRSRRCLPSFDRVCAGPPEMLLVSGYSRHQKSSPGA